MDASYSSYELLFQTFKKEPANFPGLIHRVMNLNLDDSGVGPLHLIVV